MNAQMRPIRAFREFLVTGVAATAEVAIFKNVVLPRKIEFARQNWTQLEITIDPNRLHKHNRHIFLAPCEPEPNLVVPNMGTKHGKRLVGGLVPVGTSTSRKFLSIGSY